MSPTYGAYSLERVGLNSSDQGEALVTTFRLTHYMHKSFTNGNATEYYHSANTVGYAKCPGAYITCLLWQ